MKRFTLLPAQKRFIEINHDGDFDAAYYQGGMGSGKTTGGAILGYLLAQKYPGSVGLVAAFTNTLLQDTTKEKWKEIVDEIEIERWTSGPNEKLILSNGSEIWFRPVADPRRVQSTEFHWIHVDEAGQFPTKTAFDFLLGRLRREADSSWQGFRHRIFLTGNPQESIGWLHETFIERERRDKRYRSIIAPTTDNAFLMKRQPGYVDMLRCNFDDEAARVYIEGCTGKIGENRVYRAFDRSENVRADIRYDRTRPLSIAFDFNVAFMCPIIIQERLDGDVWIVDEIAREWTETAELCDLISEKYAGHPGGIEVYGDPSGYDTRTNCRLSDWDIIRERMSMHFRPVILRVNSLDRGRPEFMVRNRTHAVNALLKDAKGKRRLYISPQCRWLIEGLQKVGWDRHARFRKEKISDPEDPRFKLDHPTDALDYYVFKRHAIAKQELRWI